MQRNHEGLFYLVNHHYLSLVPYQLSHLRLGLPLETLERPRRHRTGDAPVERDPSTLQPAEALSREYDVDEAPDGRKRCAIRCPGAVGHRGEEDREDERNALQGC